MCDEQKEYRCVKCYTEATASGVVHPTCPECGRLMVRQWPKAIRFKGPGFYVTDKDK